MGVKDITGQRFGMLTALEYVGNDKASIAMWRCICDCGNEVIVRGYSLRNGHTSSCGCKNAREDLTGKRFGRLVVLEYAGRKSNNDGCWRCECDCGTEVVVRGTCLKNGYTKSCGCYNKEVAKERNTTHGMSGTPIYESWCHMKKRCSNENDSKYYRYGARGITVCDEWNKFENFYDWSITHGYEPGLTIDRIDNDGDYCPENCRWADSVTQMNNMSTNRHVVFNGISHTIAEWARLLNVDYSVLNYRVNIGDMRYFEKYFNDIMEAR